MEPSTIDNITHVVTSPSSFAVAIAIAFGLMKLLEITLTALIKKFSKEGKMPTVEVSLDEELSRKISEMADKVHNVYEILEKTDNDGTPMVYSSRSTPGAIQEVVLVLRTVSLTQERLAHVMERLESKFNDHDRQDAMVQSNINTSLERLLRAFDDHDRRVMEAINDIKSTADDNKRSLEKLEGRHGG